MVTGALVIDPDAELKLADRLAELHRQGAILCRCDCSGPFALTLTVCYQAQLTTLRLPCLPISC